MIFYLIHAMDYLWEAYWNNPNIQIPIIIMRLLVDIFVFVLASLDFPEDLDGEQENINIINIIQKLNSC